MDSYNTGEEAEVKFRKTKAFKERENELADLKDLLQSKPLRKWLWNLLSRSRIFTTTSHLTPHEMAVASGQRDVGLWILADILEADPEILTVMQREKNAR